MQKFFSILLIVALLGLGVVLGYSFYVQPQTQDDIEEEQVFCTLDAMICPDGSAVGREGPKCEFALCPPVASCEGGACPVIEEELIDASATLSTGISDWKTYRSEEHGFEFMYPNFFSIFGESDNSQLLMFVDSGNRRGFTVSTFSGGNSENLSIHELATEEYGEDNFKVYGKVGGWDAVVNTDGSGKTILFTQGKDVFLITPFVVWVTRDMLEDDIFEPILETFRFINK